MTLGALAGGLADAASRAEVGSNLKSTLFVEAGAGSGKTSALVDRVMALLGAGFEMERIAAITFTEKAAAELRHRIRGRLLESSTATTLGERTDAALRQLDGAAVGTLHSFARRLLSEHPVEAGLPPIVEVLDDIGSQISFEERWRDFLDELLEDSVSVNALLRLEVCKVRLAHIREIAVKLNEHWDRLDGSSLPEHRERIDLSGVQARRLDLANAKQHCVDDSDTLFKKIVEIEGVLAALDSQPEPDPVSVMEILAAACDKGKAGRAGRKDNWGSEETGKDNKEAAADALHNLARPADRRSPGGEVSACQAALDAGAQSALEVVLERVAEFTVAAAEQRRAEGRLEFQDLLVRARRLLRGEEHGPVVRAALRDRYQRLLIDEFQDTDPIQVELAALIATPPQPSDGDWLTLEPDPGRLFFVGDPKQSIYRFRGADIATYLGAREWVQNSTAGLAVSLTSNFRSTLPLIGWVNDVFGELIQPEPGSQPPYEPLDAVRPAVAQGAPVTVLGKSPVNIESRAKAEELRRREATAVAQAVAGLLREGWHVCEGSAEDATPRPARRGDIAILLPSRTSLGHLEDALDNEQIPYRAEASSLVYSTREIRDLLLALRAVSDPTDELALVSALRSPLYGCGDDDLAHWRLELRGRFSLLGSVPDAAPEDHPVAEALSHLRSLHAAARWSNPAALLDRLARERGAFETAVVTGRPRDVWRRLRFVIDQARAWCDAGGTDLRRYLEWARLQGADNARVTEAVLPETDDDSVRILTVHAAKGLEFPIAVLSGMTTQLQARSRGPEVNFDRSGELVVKANASVDTGNYEAFKPLDEQMDRHERLRLLYVACTRARDHLVVSLYRSDTGDEKATAGDQSATANGKGRKGEDSAARVLAAAAAATDSLQSALDGDAHFDIAGAAALPPGSSPVLTDRPSARLPERAEWERERERVLAAAAAPTHISASGLAHQATPTGPADHQGRTDDPSQANATGSTDDPTRAESTSRTDDPSQGNTTDRDHGDPDKADVTDPTDYPGRVSVADRDGADPGLSKDSDDATSDPAPWRKGRFGTALGRAVHGVLQDVDLGLVATDDLGPHVMALARRQAYAEDIGGHRATVTNRAEAALGTEVALEAAASEHWRELFVAAPFGGRLLEGYIDLVYRSPEGLVIVDWKTDSVSGDDDIDNKLARYRLQGAAYTAALEAVTGERVARMVFVFLTSAGAEERELPDLRAAVAEAETAAAVDATELDVAG